MSGAGYKGYPQKYPSKYPGGKRVREVKSVQEALERFFSRHRGRGNFNLPQLWENWAMVMGDGLSLAALPLGVHDRTLIVGAEDSMLVHELSFCTPEILARANAFMSAVSPADPGGAVGQVDPIGEAEEYFKKVRVELLRDRAPLTPGKTSARAVESAPAERREKPAELGNLLGVLDPDSALGRAYASYVKSFEAE